MSAVRGTGLFVRPYSSAPHSHYEAFHVLRLLLDSTLTYTDTAPHTHTLLSVVKTHACLKPSHGS